MVHGFAADVLRAMPSESVDAIITDPPYSSGGMTAADRKAPPSRKYQRDDTQTQFPDFTGDNRDQRSFLLWSTLWLEQCRRVAKPGARMVVMEFAAPTWGPFRTIYSGYLMKALPHIAEFVSSDGASYGYLAESIAKWPDRKVIAGWMQAAGWGSVKVKDLSGGIVAVHRGYAA